MVCLIFLKGGRKLVNQKEIVSFQRVIQPNTTEIIKERLKMNGMIEKVTIRFYAGCEKSLKVRPYVQHHGEKMQDMFTFPEGAEKFIAGDDDLYEYDVAIEIFNDDELHVWVNNTDLNYAYTLNCFIAVNYYVGTV